MKKIVTVAAVCLALGLNVAASQATQNQQQQQQQQTPPTPPTPPQPPVVQEKTVPEVVLTGCLVQGSEPTVFLFEKALKDPKSTTEKAGRYLLVVAAEDVDLRTHLNHQIRVSGIPDNKPQPAPGQKVEEKDLPKFSAKSVTMVADTCSAAVLR